MTTTITPGRVLLVAVLALGLIVTVPAVSAHGAEPTDHPAADDSPANRYTQDSDAGATTSSWAAWMESHMNQYMGPGATEWMETQMGLSVDRMGRDMAAGPNARGGYGNAHC